MIAYKVLYQDHGKLFSTNFAFNNSVFWQQYFLDDENFPKFDFPILCFEDLKSAKFFIEDEGFDYDQHLIVYKVEGTQSEPFDYLFLPTLYQRELPDFNDLRYDIDLDCMRTTPFGCIGMKSIRFLERCE